MDVKRGEITCAALGKTAVHLPSAFFMLLKAGSHVTRDAGKARRGGKLTWKKSSEVSFHRDTIFSGEREDQHLSVCTPMDPSTVTGLSEDQQEMLA